MIINIKAVIWGALGLGTLLAAGGGLLYHKLNKLAQTVGMSVEQLSMKTSLDIEKAMVDEAIETAVDREVGRAVGNASREAVRVISADLGNQVRKNVERAYADIEDAVSKEISVRVVRTIDMDELYKDVVQAAKKTIQNKFDGKLDDILKEFNQNLENVSKIYSSIAGAVAKGENKEIVFKVST